MPERVGSRISSLFGKSSSIRGKGTAAAPDLSRDSLDPGRRSMVSLQPVVRLLSASMLAAPRFPKAPPPPHLRAGFDYTPLSSEPKPALRRRLVALVSTAAPAARFQAVFAIVAILTGFGGGLLLAWSLGLL